MIKMQCVTKSKSRAYCLSHPNLPLTSQDSLNKDIQVQENFDNKVNSKKKKNKKQKIGQKTESMCPLVSLADEEAESARYNHPSQLESDQTRIIQEENSPPLRRPRYNEPIPVADEDTTVVSFPQKNYKEWL